MAACGGGDDEPSSEPAEEAALEVPEGAVAFVDEVEDGEITQEEFDGALLTTAATQGAEPAAEGTQEYETQALVAISDLIMNRWIRGEAEELGITVTQDEIDAELESIIDTQFASEADYEKFLSDSEISEEAATDRVELQLLSAAVEQELLGEDADEAPKEAQAEAQEVFLEKWRERTVCSEDLFSSDDAASNAPEQLAERCSNFD